MEERAYKQEREQLRQVIGTIRKVHDMTLEQLSAYAKEIMDAKDYFWQSHNDMDGAEKASNRMIIHQFISSGEEAERNRKRLEKLMNSPYFGMVCFSQDKAGDESPEDIHIGLYAFADPESMRLLIHDWRAPVSSLFYDFEKGDASFEAPQGQIFGSILAKKQYKIDKGQLIYMIESAINIGDEVLQRELSHTADNRMRNIVATIQREQNAVIRDEASNVLIIQGVAGSGKTSIALHRAAFLLYRYRQTIIAGNIMILSPNRVFSDYISNVLPELGEENIPEMGFADIARDILGGKYAFQSFGEQTNALLLGKDEALPERIQFKSSLRFVNTIVSFVKHAVKSGFCSQEVSIGTKTIPADEILERYQGLSHYPVFDRLDMLADSVTASFRAHAKEKGEKLPSSARNQIRRQIRSMFQYSDPMALYRAMYQELSRPDLFKRTEDKRLEYADVFPLVFIHLMTRKVDAYKQTKHLIVDEMQDYSPVQYATLRRLFPCKMTILGDVNQSVNPYYAASPELIRTIFPEANCVELRRSYRSTYEITEFAQRISCNANLIPVERHGDAPSIIPCEDEAHQVARIREMIDRFLQSGGQTLGVLCKTQEQAETVHKALSALGLDIALIEYHSTLYASGLVVSTAYLAKGLEFDEVIVPDANDANYRSSMDANMLYIACTRAMHRLTLTHTGRLTPCLHENLP